MAEAPAPALPPAASDPEFGQPPDKPAPAVDWPLVGRRARRYAAYALAAPGWVVGLVCGVVAFAVIAVAYGFARGVDRFFKIDDI